MYKIIFLLLSFLLVTSCYSHESHLVDFATPEQVTNYIMERMNVNGNVDASWEERSEDELKTLFTRHFLGNGELGRSEEYKNEVIDHVQGTTQLKSKVKNRSANTTVTADTNIDLKERLILNVVKADKEEKICVVLSLNTTMNNTISPASVQYTVDTSNFYGGGIDMKLISATRENAASLGLDDKDDLKLFKVIRATGKSLKKRRVSSEHLKEVITDHQTVSATAVLFPQGNCATALSYECGTLARVYHHISDKSSVFYSYKGKQISYDADSHGTIVTVVKKPKKVEN